MASDSRGTASSDRHIWSCVSCRRRKVKCDRREPCDVCVKNGIECHYPVTGRLPNRGRAPQWSSPHQKQTDLLERLRRLEAVVTELSAQVDEVGVEQQQHSVTRQAQVLIGTPVSTAAALSTVDGDGEPDEDFGRLVTGGDGRVRIAKSFWSVFCDEVDHIFQSIQDASDISQGRDSNVGGVASTCCCNAFGLGGEASVLPHATMDVSPTQAGFLIQIFKKRVDPFVKVLTEDSLRRLCNSWSTPLSELSPAEAALRASVLFAATVSLEASEVRAAFEGPKDTLLIELRINAERSLTHANYLSTRDLAVLQALAIYASMLPYANMQDLAGPVAASTVQVAVQNGLHLERERNRHQDKDIREMIWLQICFLSSRFQAADAAASTWPLDGAAVTESSERLYPNSKDQRTLLYTRHMIWKLSRQLRKLGQETGSSDVESLVATVKMEVEREHEQQLLTSKTPFAEFVQKMAQLFFAKVEHALLVQKWQAAKSGSPFGPQAAQPTAAAFCDASMTTLEATHALNTRAAWAPWRWQLQGFFPWAAMRMVFAHFADDAARWTPLSERAWVLAGAVVGGAPAEVRVDAAWPALCGLMEAAGRHRAKEMERLLEDAMAGGDYMQIVEAGQRVFYSEGLVEDKSGQEDQQDAKEWLNMPGVEMGHSVELFDGGQYEQALFYDCFI
ncbi:hypothetical protein PWT90_04489 [Aphanocladium album]|nr:hypothetical protein PWT90_04489 [Aphanocladium album]